MNVEHITDAYDNDDDDDDDREAIENYWFLQ